jgi:hypothetical protein
VAQVAEAALQPEPVIAGWEAGAEVAPAQLLHCAAVLQLPGDTLLHAGAGLREAGVPAATVTGDHYYVRD